MKWETGPNWLAGLPFSPRKTEDSSTSVSQRAPDHEPRHADCRATFGVRRIDHKVSTLDLVWGMGTRGVR